MLVALSDAAWGTFGLIGAAIIGGPVVVLLTSTQRLRKETAVQRQENTEQHAEGRVILERVERKVDGVAGDLTDHLQWHLDDRPKDVA